MIQWLLTEPTKASRKIISGNFNGAQTGQMIVINLTVNQLVSPVLQLGNTPRKPILDASRWCENIDSPKKTDPIASP